MSRGGQVHLGSCPSPSRRSSGPKRPCGARRLNALLLCLQVAAGQVLKETAKPVKVAESDVDVSETGTRVCTAGKAPACERALSPPAGQAEPLV